jgi:hypothetical protein
MQAYGMLKMPDCRRYKMTVTMYTRLCRLCGTAYQVYHRLAARLTLYEISRTGTNIIWQKWQL